MALYNFSDIAKTEYVYDDTSMYSSNPADYNWKMFNPMMLVRKMLQKGNQDPEPSVPGKVVPMESVKQLYQVCVNNPMDTEIMPKTKVSDIYLCRDNAAQNEKRPSGAKLMELRYTDCTPESRFLEFVYPYSEDASAENFKVRVFVDNPNVYNIMLHRMNDYTGPIHVYSTWHQVSSILSGSIDSVNQIVIEK